MLSCSASRPDRAATDAATTPRPACARQRRRIARVAARTGGLV
ncbi:hypothetical protein BDFB_013330 [Asbolus verrucosus]|uniref:Uncharacterized protein n=1 Tax=Asbolus verrucosus TaxID=1661398 RepID=A0A482VDC7_ASBVE|nr:hypothetical protein BDFB_013330 [Asbolus verrucosus]